MNDNNNNKGNNKQGYKKKFYPKKKWNNNKNKNNNEPKNQEEILEEELVENVELTEDAAAEVEVNVAEVEVNAAEETVENEEMTAEVVEEKGAASTKKFVKEVEDEKEDFNKPEDINEEYLKIEWPLHDNMKLSPDFHRGCRLKADEYSVGSNVLRHSQCKLDSFNWLKDYHDTTYEGELKVAEIRFKNDRKDFYSYPTELELIEGELVAVETAIGHDIGIVTMVGSFIVLSTFLVSSRLVFDRAS